MESTEVSAAQMVEAGKFSAFVAKTMESNGYSQSMIQKRRDMAKGEEAFHRIKRASGRSCGFTWIFAGSWREGLCKVFGSDIDIMIVFDEVIVTEDLAYMASRKNVTVLELDPSGCPPGYSQLVLVSHGGRLYTNRYADQASRLYLQAILNDSSCMVENGKAYLSSEGFMTIWEKLLREEIADDDERYPNAVGAGHTKVSQRSGPSLPIGVGIELIEEVCHLPRNSIKDADNVLAFTCLCPSLFERYKSRPRHHGWPSAHMMQELSHLEAHVVAARDKRSLDHNMQWRLCFTRAEIRLIECLNVPQTHVIVLLKIFAKEVLRKTWDRITSYIVKNTILWMAELIPPNKFSTDTIVDRFLDCLFFLKTCIKTGFLPNYMICERNLLRQEQFTVHKKRLVLLLEDCLSERGSCLYRSPTLKAALLAMFCHPEGSVERGLARDQHEIGLLDLFNSFLPTFKESMSAQDIVQHLISGHASKIPKDWIEEALLLKEEILQDPVRGWHILFRKCLSELM